MTGPVERTGWAADTRQGRFRNGTAVARPPGRAALMAGSEGTLAKMAERLNETVTVPAEVTSPGDVSDTQPA